MTLCRMWERSAGARQVPPGIVALSAVAVTVQGCLPQPVTTEGRAVQDLYSLFLAVAAVVAAFVWIPLTWAIVRYRKRGDESLPRQHRGDVRLEIAWSVVPAVTVLGLFAATMLTLARTSGGPSAAASATPGASAPGPVEVRVEAFRWGWRFGYPADGVTVGGVTGGPAPELVLPVGQRVRLTLVGVDVVHAFFVPAFLTKQDMIPGRENVQELTIEEPGVYGGQCAEFCGVYHARMPFTVRAVPRAEYDAWLAAARAGDR